MPANTGRVPLPVPGRAGLAFAWGQEWRALLETRWQARLQEVTELALAYHDAAAAAGDEGEPRLRALLRRVITSRQALANTEEALARLSAGSYGRR